MSGFFMRNRHIGNHHPAVLNDLTAFLAYGFDLYAVPLLPTIVV